jgi:hypothetical protein
MAHEYSDDFLCPITLDIMKDPVICQDGYTYERVAITQALKKKSISPMTNLPIDPNIMIPNSSLLQLINEHRLIGEYLKNGLNDKTSNLTGADYFNESNSNNNDNFPTVKSKPKNILDIFIKSIGSKNEFIEYALEIKLDYTHIEIFHDQIFNQNIEELNNIISFNFQLHKTLYICAIFHGANLVIEWLQKQNCPISNESVNLAIHMDNMDLIIWLLSNGCVFTIYTFSYSIETLNIRILNLLLDFGCFWGILLEKHRKIIQSNKKIYLWLKSKNCPWTI